MNDYEKVLTMIREDPAIMRQFVELATTTGFSLDEVVRACAHIVIIYTEANRA